MERREWAIRLVSHEANAMANLLDIMPHIQSEDGDSASTGLDQASKNAQESRLASTICTQYGHPLSLLEGQVYTAQDGLEPKALLELMYLYGWITNCYQRRSPSL
jgi:hypothetical protein